VGVGALLMGCGVAASLCPAGDVSKTVERILSDVTCATHPHPPPPPPPLRPQAFQRADQIAHAQGKSGTHWFAPIVADAEAGFGGNLNAYELMRAMIKVRGPWLRLALCTVSRCHPTQLGVR
jgi:hypothetical protein